MVFFNWATMQMAAKIVYYGPGLCGKTSNLSYIYAKTTPGSRGEMVSLETESDRTLFFDLLPIEVGTIGGFKTRLQLYTVPGQVFYNTTRKLVLKGVDGLVFVADSQRPMREANIESFGSLVDNLDELGLEMADLPLVLQYNKRDLKNILTVEELNHDLNPNGTYPSHEASAINGNGVFETLKEITKLTLKKLRKRMASSQPGAAAAPSQPVRPAGPAAPVQRPESISAAALARAAEEGVVADVEAPQSPAEPPASVAPPMPAQPKPPDSDVFSSPPESGADEVSIAPGPLDGEAAETDPDPTPVPVEPEPDPEPIPSVEIIADQPDEAPASDDEIPVPDEPADETERVEFDTANEPVVEPPPVKRVHVSNQLDILAELEGLRESRLSGSRASSPRTSTADIDIDSLISGAVGGSRELRRRARHSLNSGIFSRMDEVELVVHVRDSSGETIHTLTPVRVDVDRADELTKLSLRFSVDLDNTGGE
jgi:signal recognition particle receptor subunit beta